MKCKIIIPYALIIILSVSTIAMATQRIYPLSDMTYNGAFRVPSETNNDTSLNYNLNGDISYDSTTSSLVIIGNYNNSPSKCAKISVPAPIKGPVSSLNRATFSANFVDITDGKQINGNSGFELASVTYCPVNSKLIYILKDEYAVAIPSTWGENCIGWANMDFTIPSGLWRLDSAYARAYDEYATMIDQAWANTNIGGYSLGVGRMKPEQSNGPTLYLSRPWVDNSGSPPVDMAISSKKIIDYGSSGHPFRLFNRASSWTASAWVNVSGKHAFAVAGTVGVRSEESVDALWYNSNGVTYKSGSNIYTTISAMDATQTSITLADATGFYPPYWEHIGSEEVYCDELTGNVLSGCTRGYNGTIKTTHLAASAIRQIMPDQYYYGDHGTDGYDAFPYIPVILFYDADQIAEVYAGTRESYNIQPYAYLVLSDYLYASDTIKRIQINGMAYDSGSNTLYVSEYLADANLPIIHSFSIADSGTSLDQTPPGRPYNIEMTDGTLTWESDDSNVMYMIYKEFSIGGEADSYRPIKVTMDKSWADPYPSEVGKYEVIAIDSALNNSSGYYAPIVTILTEAQSTTAETITIIGTLTTDSELIGSGVDVNGVTATADDGTWDEAVEAWTALGVTLSLGSNTITATGTDSNSGTDSDTTVVTRTAPTATPTVVTRGNIGLHKLILH